MYLNTSFKQTSTITMKMSKNLYKNVLIVGNPFYSGLFYFRPLGFFFYESLNDYL